MCSVHREQENKGRGFRFISNFGGEKCVPCFKRTQPWRNKVLSRTVRWDRLFAGLCAEEGVDTFCRHLVETHHSRVPNPITETVLEIFRWCSNDGVCVRVPYKKKKRK